MLQFVTLLLLLVTPCNLLLQIATIIVPPSIDVLLSLH